MKEMEVMKMMKKGFMQQKFKRRLVPLEVL